MIQGHADLEWLPCEPTEHEQELAATLEHWERIHREWLESLLVPQDLLFPKSD